MRYKSNDAGNNSLCPISDLCLKTSHFGIGTVHSINRGDFKKVSGTRCCTQCKTPPNVSCTSLYRAVEKRHKQALTSSQMIGLEHTSKTELTMVKHTAGSLMLWVNLPARYLKVLLHHRLKTKPERLPLLEILEKTMKDGLIH